MTNKVSVIMPVYNAASYLEESVKSVLNQSYKNFELILVDDGSKDKSPEIVDSFAKSDSRVVVIHQANSGADAARNSGIDRATGEIITFIDSDDYIDTLFLEKMVNSMIDNNCQMVVCRFEPFGISNPPQVKLLDGGIVNQTDAIVHCLGYNSFNGYVWNKAFLSKVIFDNNLRFEAGYFPNEDVLFAGKYISYCSTVYILPDVLYHYRQNNVGANRGRYSGKQSFDKKRLNTLKATESLRNFYNNDIVNFSCKLHDVREASIILRSMAAGKYKGDEYKELLRFIRKNARFFYKTKEASRNQKLSVWLSTLSPNLELFVWKIVNK